MAIIKPFRAFRPTPELAPKIASLPFDVMTSHEARQMAKDKPHSFLHVVKSEIDLDPAIDIHDQRIYEKARENLGRMIADGLLIQDPDEYLYIYREIMGAKTQTGLVSCTSIDDYINGIIKIHEHTRPRQVQDRMNYIDACNANTGLIFLTYRTQESIDLAINAWISAHAPVYDFTSGDGVQHTIWVINHKESIHALVERFKAIECFYVADGHHRTASAVNVGIRKRAQNPDYTGDEAFNYFLSVLFPSNQLSIMDYNRVVKDLHGLSEEEFLQKVKQKFAIEPYQGTGQYKPAKQRTFGMYLRKRWYTLIPEAGTYCEDDPVECLDISILQNNLLTPILGIHDPKTDKRIDCIGGIRGLQELERRVANGKSVAFSIYPPTIEEVMAVADAGKIMPPKSTWFEPKLRSGLFVHKL